VWQLLNHQQGNTATSNSQQGWRLPPIHSQIQLWLKIAATALMIADHIHLVFFLRSETWLFWITRLVYPMFMLLVAYNLEYRRAKAHKYVVSLLLFGSLAQPFYMMAFGFTHFNVMFTLATGVLLHQALVWSRPRVHVGFRLIALLALLTVPFEWLEGGVAGVLMIPAFANLFRRGAWWDWLLAFGVCMAIPTGTAPWWLIVSVLLIWGIASGFKFKTTELKPSRWIGLVLYWVYPVHLCVIALSRL
jgi:hypothetical protein